MPLRLPLPSPHRVLSALLIATLAPPALPAMEAPAKDHSIFVGVDVALERKGKYYRVIGAEKNAVQIMLDRKVTVVPLSEARNLRVDRGVKLSNLRAHVTDLRGDQGDSKLRVIAEAETIRNSMAVQDEMEDRRDRALGEAVLGSIQVQKAGGGTRTNAADEAMAQLVEKLPELGGSIDMAAQIGNDMVTRPANAQADLNDRGFVVSFAVSAPGPLEQCHVAVVADYSLPGESGLTLSNVTLEPLGPLGPVARKARVEVRHFPPGAELKGYRVALYSHGQEIATNLSSRRTDITRDETVLYLTMDHLARHPGETLPPTPVLMVPRAEFVSRLGSAPLDQVVYARVGKDGKIIRLSTDLTGSVRLPSGLGMAAEQIAFVPALEKGKPVEGVAKFKLADLVAGN